MTHLPRAAQSRFLAAARAVRRKRREEAAKPLKTKTPRRPSQAFSAVFLKAPPVIAANAASSSD